MEPVVGDVAAAVGVGSLSAVVPRIPFAAAE